MSINSLPWGHVSFLPDSHTHAVTQNKDDTTPAPILYQDDNLKLERVQASSLSLMYEFSFLSIYFTNNY